LFVETHPLASSHGSPLQPVFLYALHCVATASPSAVQLRHAMHTPSLVSPHPFRYSPAPHCV
jgi:hypothetical protein